MQNVYISTHEMMPHQIIKKLQSLGGRNPEGLCGTSTNAYYYIDSYGNITYSSNIPAGYKSITSSNNEMKKPAIYQTGKINGEDILNYFKNLGAKIRQNWTGTTAEVYYFIEEDNYLQNCNTLPSGYEEVFSVSFPKEMYVSDASSEAASYNKIRRLVLGTITDTTGRTYYLAEHSDQTGVTGWKYAVDIQKPTIVEITMDEIAALKGVDVSQIRIKE